MSLPEHGGGSDFNSRTLFVGVGAMKSGTTWLADRLSHHPEVLVSPLKELHWFDQDEQRFYFERRFAMRAARILEQTKPQRGLNARAAVLLRRLAMLSDDDYVNLFRDLTKPDHLAFGEISPSYGLLDPAGFRRIFAIHPNVKLIYLMRNPVDRFWSHCKHRSKRGGHALPANDDVSLMPAKVVEGMLEKSSYQRTVAALREAVPAEHLFLCFYEDLFGEKTAAPTLDQLWSFLGVTRVPTSVQQLQRQVNVTNPSLLRGEARRRVVGMLEPTYRWALESLSGLPSSWVQDASSFTR